MGAALLLAVPVLGGCGEKTEPGLTEADLSAISSSEDPVLFCGNNDLTGFDTQVFTENLGLETLKYEKPIGTTEDLKKVFESLPLTVSDLYLYMDPASVPEGEKDTYLQTIKALGESRPEMQLSCMLAVHPLSDWTALREEETEAVLGYYDTWVQTLSDLPSCKLYFAGFERWLILNSDNFNGNVPNPDVADRLMKLSFADGVYRINVTNSKECFDILKSHIDKERTEATVYPDLSDLDIVMIGDSIIGNFKDSTSIPGATAAISNARTYNIGKGGAVGCTVDPVEDINSFISMAHAFADGDVSRMPKSCPCVSSLERYLSEDHKDRKLCFVINFGLNDYFAGKPAWNEADPEDETVFYGGIRAGIRILKETYPEATILIMTPNFTTFFGNGTLLPMGEPGSPLIEYVEGARKAAADEGVLCLDNYGELGINEENAELFLGDGVHYNENGRLIVAERIVYTLSVATAH